MVRQSLLALAIRFILLPSASIFIDDNFAFAVLVGAFAPQRLAKTRRLQSLSRLYSRFEESQQQQLQRQTPFIGSNSTRSNSDTDWVADTLNGRNPLTRFVKGPKECLVFDTTLRDGTQGESVSASCEDKLKIATRLAAFDVDYIEAGWPGSNPKDADFFRRAQTELSAEARSKLVAFGSSRRKNVSVEQDAQIQK